MRTPGRARPRSARSSFIHMTEISSFRPSLDAQRYALFRSGLSPEEIAARENVSLATITRSIERMKMERELSSKEAIETATRRSVLSALPTATNSLLAALTATRDKIIETMDAEGETTTSIIQEADHALRLKALDSLTRLIDSTKESSPMVSIANQNLQQNAVAFNGQPGLSSESIIRQIRQERGLALPEEAAKDNLDVTILPDTIDFELKADLEELEEAEEK